jgi:hypothetical protein
MPANTPSLAVANSCIRAGWPGREWFAAAFFFFATACFVLWQNTQIAILWDLSYLLDTSWRIALGQMPYRDFPLVHAPLTFLIQAAIMRLGYLAAVGCAFNGARRLQRLSAPDLRLRLRLCDSDRDLSPATA